MGIPTASLAKRAGEAPSESTTPYTPRDRADWIFRHLTRLQRKLNLNGFGARRLLGYDPFADLDLAQRATLARELRSHAAASYGQAARKLERRRDDTQRAQEDFAAAARLASFVERWTAEM